MFSVITNIYNKKPEGTTLMELFTATGKLYVPPLPRDLADLKERIILVVEISRVDACVART
jgi:hypothetical protein